MKLQTVNIWVFVDFIFFLLFYFFYVFFLLYTFCFCNEKKNDKVTQKNLMTHGL